MEFAKQYEAYLKDINEELDRISAVPELLQKSVFSAMQYGLHGGGKRIRPVLTVAVCDLLGGNHQDAVKVACAIECIHNYSLIHDDLPCMDDDDLRRGRPTCHKVFPENIALLAGDGLLNLAFELLSDTTRYETLSDSALVRLIGAVSRASGAYGMIGGQVIDLESEGLADMTLERLLELHRGKTGELIRVAAECGCICAGLEKNDEKYQKIMEFSAKLGLAFQVKDDILDVIGQEELVGKPIGSDAESQKNTFVTFMGLEGAEMELSKLTEEAKNALSGFWQAEFLLQLADYLLTRKY
ncbi:MAG: polyprenyl synthetase family protein [Clostridia bacterium]|nr:polyprenyl synthetase family protein [Clostridia bacterium]